MTPLTQWKISKDGLGSARVYTADWNYAGGVVTAAFDGGAVGQGDAFDIYLVDNATVVIAYALSDQNNNTTTFAWSTCDGTQMVFKTDQAWSNIGDPAATGPDKRFGIENAGGGRVRLQSKDNGRWISGSKGGWFVDQWGMGSASITEVSAPDTVQVSGDHWFVFLASGSAYDLDLRGRDFGARSLAGVDLRTADLESAGLSQITDLAGANFAGADLSGARLPRLSLGAAHDFGGARFVGTDLTAIADAHGAPLGGADLQRAHAPGVDFKGADLKQADLRGAALAGADFSGADLRGALFAGAQLAGACFEGANMQGTVFDHADLTGTRFDAVPDFTRATAGRTTFVGATVPFESIGHDWSYLDLTDARLTDLPATISGLVADAALLPDGLDLRGKQLADASFVGTRMAKADLRGCTLTGAHLAGARLEGARLDGADLSRADLTGAWLIAEQKGDAGLDRASAATAVEATMIDTLLDAAHCDGVDFSQARFLTWSFESADQPARARGAEMNFAKFDDAILVGADFESAQLSGASFGNAVLVGASFRGADLGPTGDSTHSPTTMSDTDLRGVDFSGANLDALDMQGAKISTAKGRFSGRYAIFGGRTVPLDVDYGPTVKGDTTPRTILPEGW